MTASDKAGIAVESCDQAFARAHSAYGCYKAAGIRQHNIFERATLIKKRAGFIGALDRDAHNQVGICNTGQAGLQQAGIIKRCPFPIAVHETVTPFVRQQMIAVPANNRAIVVDWSRHGLNGSRIVERDRIAIAVPLESA